MRRHLILLIVPAAAVVALSQSSAVSDPVGTRDDRAPRCQARFTGGPESDTIRGDRHDNVICGRGSYDYLYGNLGDDIIRGGSGQDDISGGADYLGARF